MWNLPRLLTDAGVDIEEEDITEYLLDFDFAIMDFWDWFTGMRDQKKKVTIPSSMRLKDNQTWGAKYTDQEILDKYSNRAISHGPVSDKITEDELWDVMEDWNIDEIPENA